MVTVASCGVPPLWVLLEWRTLLESLARFTGCFLDCLGTQERGVLAPLLRVCPESRSAMSFDGSVSCVTVGKKDGGGGAGLGVVGT